MNYKDVIKAGEEYLQIFSELLDSGQISEKQKNDKLYKHFEIIKDHMEEVEISLHKYLAPKPTKKANLVTGELRIHTGIFDFKESAVFQIQIFSRVINLGVENTAEEFALWLEQTFDVSQDDIFINQWNIDTSLDTLSMTIAFQTDWVFETPRNDISLLVGKRAQGGGYFNQNKAYLRNADLDHIPLTVYQWMLKGFAIPYTISLNNMIELISAMRTSADNNGELADLRAFSQTHRNLIDPFVEELKAKRWNQIFTQWGKWKMNADGSYRKY